MSSRIDEIVQKIRREIELDPPPGPARPEDDALPMVRDVPEFSALHEWLRNPESRIGSHRRLFGRAASEAKRWLRRMTLSSLPFAELVHFTNALAERTDRLLTELTERTKAVAERNDLFLAAFDLRLEALEARDQMRAAGELSAESGNQGPDLEEALVAEAAVDLAEGLAKRLELHLERFRGRRRVLDLGCGRGEILERLAACGASAEGIEASGALVASCRARGLAVALAPVPGHLAGLSEAALDGLLVSRLADRVPRARWAALAAQAWRTLAPDGILLLEGVHGVRDRDFLRWILARQRFEAVEVHCSGAAGAAGALRPIPGKGSEVVALNENLERLTALLFADREHVFLARRGSA